MASKYIYPILIGTIPIIMGSLVGYFGQSKEGKAWYDKLDKPSYIPPPIVFSIIWPILYVLFGLSMTLYLWKTTNIWRYPAFIVMIVFIFNMISNLLFTPLQFRYKSLEGAMIVCYLAFVSALALLFLFYYLPLKQGYNRLSALFILPYVLWLALACVMSTHLFVLNTR